MPSILLTALTAIVAATTISVTKPAEKALQDDTSNQYEVIDLKDRVLKGYYSELDDSIKSKLDYETFENNYLESDMSIRDYTNSLKQTANNGSTRGALLDAFVPDARHIISNHRGSWPFPNTTEPQLIDKENMSLNWDQNHIMNFNITNKRDPDLPIYYEREQLTTISERESYVPWYSSFIQPGDIVWDTISSIPIDFNDFVTHMAMVVNTNKRGMVMDSYGATRFFNFIETIEAFAGGVRYGFLDDDRILECGTKVLRVNGATETQRINAVEFCMHQYGETYELNPLEVNYNVPTGSRNKWYCTQLVFAAYYHQGIDLSYNASENYSIVSNGKITTPIIGDMIDNGDCTEEIHFDPEYENKFIKISKNGSSYVLSNTSSRDCSVRYTGSLYNFCDAATKYKDICNEFAYIRAHSSVSVQISSNFLANTVAVYYKEGNTMYATAAHFFGSYSTNSFYKTTVDNYSLKKINDNEYKISVKNKSSEKKYYTVPTCLLSYNDAINKNFNNTKSFSVDPGKTVSVTILKSGNNKFAPIVISGLGKKNNAALIKINIGKTLYASLHAVSVAKPVIPTPEPIVSPYPKVSPLYGETTYYFNFGDFNSASHGGTEWYEVVATVPVKDVLEWDWNTIQITEVIQDNDANSWNEYIYFDDSTGEFHIQLSTFNSDPDGCVRIRYTFTGSLILQSLSLSGDYKTDYFVGESLDTSGVIVNAHDTYTFSHQGNILNGTLCIYSPDFNSEVPGEYTVIIEYTEVDVKCVTSYDVTVRYPDITSVELSGYQTVFGIGDEFSFDGLVATMYLEDGSIVEADYCNVDDSEVDMNNAGEYTVYVEAVVNDMSYQTSYTITVEDRSLVSITLSGNQQTSFEVGDTFNYDGLVVTAHYANGDERVVTDYTVIIRTIDMNTAGTYNVKVRYTENDVTVSTTYQITVVYNGPSLTGITLSGDYQTSFQVGEQFNHDGLVVTAHYSDGTSRVVTNYAVMPMNYNPNSPGTYNVIINYSSNAGFAITSYTVTVEFLLIPVFLDSITLSGNYKTNYRMGQALNFTGLIVTANYTDGSSEEVTDYVIDTSAVNMLLPGYYDVRVLYTFKGTTAVAIFTIHIGRFIKDPDLPFLPDDPIKPFPGKF